MINTNYTNPSLEGYTTPKKKKLESIEDRVEKVYRACLSEDKIQFLFDDLDKKRKNVIYAVWHDTTYKTYIGKTIQEAQKRLCQHASKINNPKDYLTDTRTKFYQEVRKNPLDFCFGFVDLREYSATELEDLAEIEKKEIAKTPKNLLLNSNKGGGGSITAKSRSLFSQTKKSPPKKLTPDRYFPVVGTPYGAKCDFSPNTANLSGVIYQIKNNDTNKIYIGQSTQKVSRRISQHFSYAKKVKDKEGFPLQKDLIESPESFSVGVVEANFSPSKILIIEKNAIKVKSESRDLYNNQHNPKKRQRSMSQ